MFPEFIRTLVLSGAQVILNATDWITDTWQSTVGWGGDTVASLVRIRALENGVHVAMADRAGVEAGWRSLGCSTVAAPTGRVLATLGADEGIALATIDVAIPISFAGRKSPPTCMTAAPNFMRGALDVPDLDFAATALVVVDMQNDFVRQGAPLEVPDARSTIASHRRLLKYFRDLKGVIVFTRFVAGPRQTLIWNWSSVLAPPTCCCWPGFMRTYGDVEGPRDAAAVIDEVEPLPTELQIDKYNYGAFARRACSIALRHRVSIPWW